MEVDALSSWPVANIERTSAISLLSSKWVAGICTTSLLSSFQGVCTLEHMYVPKLAYISLSEIMKREREKGKCEQKRKKEER
jgi:hypothetical protein